MQNPSEITNNNSQRIIFVIIVVSEGKSREKCPGQRGECTPHVWGKKKPINIKNFGGTPPGLCFIMRIKPPT